MQVLSSQGIVVPPSEPDVAFSSGGTNSRSSQMQNSSCHLGGEGGRRGEAQEPRAPGGLRRLRCQAGAENLAEGRPPVL